MRGQPPYGLRYENGALVPDPTEQRAIRIAQAAKRSGATLREIGRQLEQQGFPSRRGDHRWHPQSITRILKRNAEDTAADNTDLQGLDPHAL